MLLYSVLLVIHILSAVLWMGALPADLLLRKAISTNKGKDSEKAIISVWLKLLNISGMIGLIGILITGIVLSIVLGLGFFQFASGGNHWLYTKQFLMIFIIIITGAFIIPTAKKIRIAVQNDLAAAQPLRIEAYSNIRKLSTLANVLNALIFLNFLLAITRQFIPR